MKNLICFLLLTCTANAQLHEVAEVSMMLPEELDEEIDLLVAGDDIVMLLNLQSSIITRDDDNLVVYKFNFELKHLWTSMVAIPKLYEPVSYLASDDALFYLINEKAGKKMKLFRFELDTGQWTVHEFELLTSLYQIEMQLFNGYLLLAGQFNEKPVVEMHSLVDKTARVLPEIYFKNNQLRGMSVNPYRNELYVFSALQNKCQFQVTIYDEFGKFVTRHALGDKKHKINRAEIRISDTGEPLVTGTYNSSCHDMALGFFSGSLDQPQKLHYHVISNMKSYANLLSPKRQERRMLKMESGKANDIRQRAIFSVPFSGADAMVMSAEIYTQQTMSQVSLTNATDGSMRRMPRSYYEYRTNRLLLAEVGYDGHILRDKMVKIEGNSYSDLRPKAAFIYKNNSFYGLLPNKKEISYINMSDPEAHVEKLPVLTSETLRISDIDISLTGWTPNSVIAHGVAYIQVGSGENSRSRQMYYIKRFEIKDDVASDSE